MSGQKIVLSGTPFTNPLLPKIRVDSLLSAGSLLLFDGSHSQGVFSGVPAIAGSAPNIAWVEAAALIGSGSATTLAMIAGGSLGSSGKFVTERTSKGGIHGIISQSAFASGTSAGYTLKVANLIRDYMFANLAHEYYVSAWSKVTRPSIGSALGSPFISYQSTAAGSNDYLFQFRLGVPRAPTNGSRVYPSDTETSTAAGTNRFTNAKTAALSGTGPISTSAATLLVGTLQDEMGYSDLNKAASRIIYRSYIEDLTVSGRTYAEVDAIDYALWQKAFGVGGKFYGDTYTSPSTLP